MQQILPEAVDVYQLDPVAKIMLVAFISETSKIQDYIDGTFQRIVERFCTDFIPHRKINAMPAVCLVRPDVNEKADGLVSVGSGVQFSYRPPQSSANMSYIPIFNTALMPHSGTYLLTPRLLRYDDRSVSVRLDRPNRLWVGIRTPIEVYCLKGLSLFISGTGGVTPEHIAVGPDCTELEFAPMQEVENIEMAEPFDAQQASGQFFSYVENWKDCLSNIPAGTLVYITDGTKDRDIYKPRAFPRVFQQWLESEVLDIFQAGTIWLRIDFPEGYQVPDDCDVTLNLIPVTDVSVNSVTLTPAQPIAKLQGDENTFFLDILETSTAANRRGFGMNSEDIMVRDFEANCYNNADLYRDVRNLYNHFIDDYYAFIEYNGIKDGEVLKKLRETINRVGKSVGTENPQYKFDSGTYVMKNMNQSSPTSATTVSFITTHGQRGNMPRAGETMTNESLPGCAKKTLVCTNAMAGTDKASPDERYEQLRYYSLTNDRLFTRMDIDAFLRKELLAEFGKEEFHRIFVKISIQGTGGEHGLKRGLYIDIEFKDRRNYEHAANMYFDTLMQQRIESKSCIAMPIIVTLKNLED